MRGIHIANVKNRDAEVAFGSRARGKKVTTVLTGGRQKEYIRILKNTVETDLPALEEKYGTLAEIAVELAASDPEVDMETAGRKLRHTHKLYVDKNNNIAYHVNLMQVVRNPDGTERETRDLNKLPGNVNKEVPLKWTGKMFPRREAIRRFVFSRKYQLRHVNGATFDFLYNMARELDGKDSLVLIGTGSRGTGPILLSRGGSPYRGFLEGRVSGDRYCLILHLTDIELKGLDNGTVQE